MNTYATTNRDMTIRMLIGAVGAVFILVGLWGFYDSTFFGIFELTTTHNWVHVAAGAILAAVAFLPVEQTIVAWTARITGIVFALLGVVGFFAPNMLAPLIHLGNNENLFHVVIGATTAVLGFLLPTHETTRMRRSDTAVMRRH